jgi:uncharacterized membrane protein YqiK
MIADILFSVGVTVASLVAVAVAVYLFLGVRYIPHRRVGIIEKLWSASGSLTDGRIIALNGEAGFQAKVLRGGLYFGYPFWKFTIHKVPLVTVAEGRIGYVYARDGQPLQPVQTLGHIVDCNGFQDAVGFLQNGGQRGRQRGILREGVYAINTAVFMVITETGVHTGPISTEEHRMAQFWREELQEQSGFVPVIVGNPKGKQPSEPPKPGGLAESDNVGVVTIHDGPSLEAGDVIAPEVRDAQGGSGHNYYQDPETFLKLGGRRGKQLQVLTDGTYFINRWFATVELKPKTLIPIGYVGVVIGYFGGDGTDVTGVNFRYGEQVESGRRGVWKQALTPGKYALNPYALKVELVPTVNFVLRWISGQTETHKYDENLASIPIITADGYEPMLPLSLVLHIDYQKAPRVVQRFGDVNRLISQTLDPILTAYFRDVAQSSNMLDLLTQREEIQRLATEELGRRFEGYDINCVAVLIGRPESVHRKDGEDPIDALFDQLRQRRLAEEQKETFAKQQEAANRLKELNQAQAEAARQTHLTETQIEIEVSANRGSAQLAEAEKLAKREIAMAEGQARVAELTGKGEALRIRQIAEAEADKIARIGESEAEVSRQKVAAFGDNRLYALNLVSGELANSKQPLVPEKLVMLGGGEGGAAGAQAGIFQAMIQLLTAWDNLKEDETTASPEITKADPPKAA